MPNVLWFTLALLCGPRQPRGYTGKYRCGRTAAPACRRVRGRGGGSDCRRRGRDVNVSWTLQIMSSEMNGNNVGNGDGDEKRTNGVKKIIRYSVNIEKTRTE